MIHPALTQVPTVAEVVPSQVVRVMAGLADKNPSLFVRLGLPLGDPAAWIRWADGRTTGLVRDLEMDRVRSAGRLDEVICPAKFATESSPLSGDRETAVAQALGRCLKQNNIDHVAADRTFPMIMIAHLTRGGIAVHYDDEMGVIDRRTKTSDEINSLRRAQSITEEVMELACRRIASAESDAEGWLSIGGQPLTAESVRNFAAIEFLQRGFTMTHGAIIAAPPHGGDCHHSGTGPLQTGVPIIVDLFPRDLSSRYHGDCTRTVVHGTPSDEVLAMHAAVIAAKHAAESQLRVGRTGQDVQLAVEHVLQSAGYAIHRGEITEGPSIQHGTGHGIGLEIHEPILLDHGGGELLDGEVFTVEPGLYGRRTGGVRVEDMLVVTDGPPINLNRLPMGLDWT